MGFTQLQKALLMLLGCTAVQSHVLHCIIAEPDLECWSNAVMAQVALLSSIVHPDSMQASCIMPMLCCTCHSHGPVTSTY